MLVKYYDGNVDEVELPLIVPCTVDEVELPLVVLWMK